MDDVGSSGAAGNQRGPFVDPAVPHCVGGIIAGVAREDEGAAQTSLELLESHFVKDRLHCHDALISHDCPLALCVGSTSLAAKRSINPHFTVVLLSRHAAWTSGSCIMLAKSYCTVPGPLLRPPCARPSRRTARDALSPSRVGFPGMG